MRRYVIRPFSDWAKTELLEIDARLWTPPVDVAAWGQIARTAEGLLVRLTAREAHVRAVEDGPLGNPWEDSCLEFFFAPVPGDARYVNIEFNPNACVCVGLGDGSFRTRLLPEQDWLAPRTFATPDGWGVEYRVPYAFIRTLFNGFDPAPGDVIRANCYKCGDKTPRPHFLAWNPVTSEAPNFHRPQDFGEMVLGN